jgi:DNA-directed RNA polymerase specialized sigma24 family protein
MSLKSVPQKVAAFFENDYLLSAYVKAPDDVEAGRQLSVLIAQHDHIIKRTITTKLGVHPGSTARGSAAEDYDEVYSDTLLRLIDRLHSLRSAPDELSIRDFSSYLSAIARNSCDEFLRRKYPQRHRLKKRLRYVLTHSPGFGLWRKDDGEWMCGPESWRSAPQSLHISVNKGAMITGISDANPLVERMTEGEDQDAARNGAQQLRRVLGAIFEELRRPIGLDELVGIVGEALGITDGHHFVASETTIADHRADAASELIFSSRVSALWDEICRLPLRQRVALLFNLRDARGHSAIGLFPILNVASIERIAGALEMPAEELAALWNRLPMEDAMIAKHLGITRQQVINLRKSARQRLANRTRSFGQ